MAENILILFLSALIPGLLAFYIRAFNNINYKLILAFAGSYLFSITVVHIMPELFSETDQPDIIGFYVLIGFFLQLFLQYLTSGAEHGHLHDVHHTGTSPVLLVLGLCLHALMEGTLLAHPSSFHPEQHAPALLFGIVLHKMPAAFVFTTILIHSYRNKIWVIVLLTIFALASPAGIILSDFLNSNPSWGKEYFLILMAVVSGNFLHISTTIFFETSPDHRFNIKRLIISILGAGFAVLFELL